MHAAVFLDHVSKDYPVNLRGQCLRAVDGLDLTVPAGSVYGLLGPNGGGKSTTLKLILGLIVPTRGQVRVFGHEAGSIEARRALGYLPELPHFPRFLTGRELIHHYGRLSGLPTRGLGVRVREMLAWVRLEGAADRRVGTYSKGMLQRIGLAQALVHDPQLVILDEPAAGVDPLALADLSEVLGRLKQAGKTVLITTHQLASVETLCDRVALLHRGRLVVEGSVEDLTRPAGIDGQALWAKGLTPALVEDLAAWLGERGGTLERVEPARRRLEDVFIAALSGAHAEAKA